MNRLKELKTNGRLLLTIMMIHVLLCMYLVLIQTQGSIITNQCTKTFMVEKGGIFELYKPTNFQINSTQSLEQDLGKLKEQLASEIEPEKRTEIETSIKPVKGKADSGKNYSNCIRACPLTDLDVRSLLLLPAISNLGASAIMKRGLDPFNGLMLAPNIDALFDSGLITFDADGTIKISPKIDLENQKRLGISPDMKLKIEPESQNISSITATTFSKEKNR